MSRLHAYRILDSWRVELRGTGYRGDGNTLAEAWVRLNTRLADPTWEPWREVEGI
jgi:hypothetical protein